MIVRRDYGLAGKFKFDVYSKNDKLKYTSDYIDNFITSSGLNYVLNYAFADCFRYVSLGTGSNPNTIVGIGTTGLHLPVSKFSYIGGNATHSSCDASVSANKYVTKGCGYRLGDSGVTLFRAWRIPEGDTNFFTQAYNFTEYMLSPGCPSTTGFYGDSTIGSVCACNQALYSDITLSSFVYGKESPDIISAYPTVCEDTKAFTRILKNISVGVDEYLVVNYALDVNYVTGTVPFSVGVTRNNPVPFDPGVDLEIYNWAQGTFVKGASSLIHPGIKLINNGTIASIGAMAQIPTDFQFRVGESFIPPLGMPMEPSCPLENRDGYISNDNIQFIANSLSGGISGGGYNKNNLPSGVMLYHKNWITETSYGTDLSYPWWVRPRSEVTLGFSQAYPSNTNTKVVGSYSSIPDTTNTDDGTFLPQSITPNVVSQQVNTLLPFAGRTRANAINFQFKSNTVNPRKFPVRAFVYGYTPNGGVTTFPVLDSLIYPSGGGTLVPPINTTAKTFPGPSGVVTKSQGSTGYYYFDQNNILQLQLSIKWSALCPNGVIGCP